MDNQKYLRHGTYNDLLFAGEVITNPLFLQPQRISSAEDRHRRIHLSLPSIPSPKLASSDLRDGDHRCRDSIHSPHKIRIFYFKFLQLYDDSYHTENRVLSLI